jgi:hypothetical protein
MTSPKERFARQDPRHSQTLKRLLLLPSSSHLSLEINADVLPGGKRHHLAILGSALGYVVILAAIKNSPKFRAYLTGLRLLITH